MSLITTSCENAMEQLRVVVYEMLQDRKHSKREREVYHDKTEVINLILKNYDNAGHSERELKDTMEFLNALSKLPNTLVDVAQYYLLRSKNELNDECSETMIRLSKDDQPVEIWPDHVHTRDDSKDSSTECRDPMFKKLFEKSLVSDIDAISTMAFGCVECAKFLEYQLEWMPHLKYQRRALKRAIELGMVTASLKQDYMNELTLRVLTLRDKVVVSWDWLMGATNRILRDKWNKKFHAIMRLASYKAKLVQVVLELLQQIFANPYSYFDTGMIPSFEFNALYRNLAYDSVPVVYENTVWNGTMFVADTKSASTKLDHVLAEVYPNQRKAHDEKKKILIDILHMCMLNSSIELNTYSRPVSIDCKEIVELVRSCDECAKLLPQTLDLKYPYLYTEAQAEKIREALKIIRTQDTI